MVISKLSESKFESNCPSQNCQVCERLQNLYVIYAESEIFEPITYRTKPLKIFNLNDIQHDKAHKLSPHEKSRKLSEIKKRSFFKEEKKILKILLLVNNGQTVDIFYNYENSSN